MTGNAMSLRTRLGELARSRRSAMAHGAAGAAGAGAVASEVAGGAGASGGASAVAGGAGEDSGGPFGSASCSTSLPGGSLRHPWLPRASDAPPESSPAPPATADGPPRVSPASPLAVDTSPAVGVEQFLPGGEWRDERGAVYVHERLRSEIEKPKRHWGSLGEPSAGEPDLAALSALGLEHALFLDLETGGLSSAPVFLAGTMHWNGSDFVLRQYFARHYGEEATLLGALARATRGFEFLVTFNGKSYDVPFLRDRANLHRVRVPMPPRHLDLLHPSRRRWRCELPDCRLQTLEMRVCRRRRSGDVPGEQIPGLYHDFVRHGDPFRLVPVFHHNLLDVITMGEVLSALCR